MPNPFAFLLRPKPIDDLDSAIAAKEKLERQEREQLKKKLKALSKDYERILKNSLARAGAVYRWTEQGARQYRKIKFKNIVISLDGYAIYFQVDTLRLPDQVLISFLRNPDVIETACASCRRQVEVKWNSNTPEKGFWYVVQLKMGNRGIPREVDYSKLLDLLEQRKDATSLTIPIGCGENGRVVFRELKDFPHALVAGATNQGKSVWIKQTLVTLLLRNEPQHFRLILVDLKGGVELSQFRSVPHLLMPIIKHKNDVTESLRRVLKEVDHRLKVFESVGVVNIGEYKKKRHYNNRPSESFPYWLLVIDELANVMLDPEIKGDPATLLADIAARARATGIYVIAATQHPSVDIISGLIKANFPVRIAFSTSSSSASRVIIDSGEAYGLSPAGRMIFFMGKDKLELQGPYISSTMVEDKINGIVSGKRVETLERSRRHSFTPEDFFRHSITRYKGVFSYRNIFEDFRTLGVSRTELENLAYEYEGKEFIVDDDTYTLTPPQTINGKQGPRHLRKIEQPEEASDNIQQASDETITPETENIESAEFTASELPASQRHAPSPRPSKILGDPETDETEPEKEYAE